MKEVHAKVAEQQAASLCRRPVSEGATGALMDRDADVTVTSDPGAEWRVLNRLRRAQGQLAAVIRAVEEGSPAAIVTAAATSGPQPRRRGAHKQCDAGVLVPEAARSEGELTPGDLEELFRCCLSPGLPHPRRRPRARAARAVSVRARASSALPRRHGSAGGCLPQGRNSTITAPRSANHR